MNGLDPAMMQRMQSLIQQNPRIAMLLQKPGLMQKLQSIAQNPNDPVIAQQYASDPDVQELMKILGPAMGGMGGMGGIAQNNNQYQQAQQAVTYIMSETQFYDIVNKAPKSKLIVVDFFATWCGPCKAIAPDFERFAKLYSKEAIFCKVDVDKNKSLAKQQGIAAMPTFYFYKDKVKITEMRGSNVQKLEQIIVQNLSSNDDKSANLNMKPSPFQTFPLHEKNRPIYKKMPIKKMNQKLFQLNDELLKDEKAKKEEKDHNGRRSLDESECKLLTQIMQMLQEGNNFYVEQKFNASHYALLEKMLNRWPASMLPPVLDLIRVLSLHPSFATDLSKNFEFVVDIMKIAGNGINNAVNGMLCCRIIINLFARRVMARVLEQNYVKIVDHLIFNMLCNEKKNTRLAFVRVLIHFAYCFYVIGYSKSNESDIYRAEKLKCFSLFSEILYRESDNDIILNILMGMGTLLFRDENVIQFAETLDMTLVFKSYKQRFANDESGIAECCGELIQAMQNPEL